jgi:hypothetical protein
MLFWGGLDAIITTPTRKSADSTSATVVAVGTVLSTSLVTAATAEPSQCCSNSAGDSLGRSANSSMGLAATKKTNIAA